MLALSTAIFVLLPQQLPALPRRPATALLTPTTFPSIAIKDAD